MAFSKSEKRVAPCTHSPCILRNMMPDTVEVSHKKTAFKKPYPIML